MRSRTLGQWGIGAVALSVALTACGGSSGGSAAKPGASGSAGGTVSIFLTEPQFLTPANTNETNGSEVLDALYTGLVKYDAENKPVLTDLAESIESPDNTVWTIKIKSGWTFHDGTPVTADSFIDAWNYAAYGPNGQNNAYFFGPDALGIKGYADLQAEKEGATPKAKTLAGLVKVDGTTFTVTLDKPSNVFKTALGYTAFYPMPKAFFTMGEKKFQEAPIGDGPFKMSGSWVHNQKITVVRYDDYKGSQKPHVQQLDYKIYSAAEAAYNDLEANNLDVLTQIPPSQLVQAKNNLGDRYKDFPSSNYGFLGFPTFDPAFKDVNVRKAISMSIDRASISKTIFNGTRVPADDFIAPVVPGYRKGACGELCTYDVEKAKTYWAAAATKPSTITLTYNADGGHKEWIEAACNNIKQALAVGCVGKPAPDFATLLNQLDKARKSKASFGAFRLGWVMDYPSAQDYLGPLYSTTGSSNYYGYSNPTFDGLITKGLSESSDDAAIADWQQADDILAKEAPIAPVYFGSSQVGFSDKVANVSVDSYFRVDKFALTTK